MKYFLILLTLMCTFGLTGVSPVTASAADPPAASVMAEPIQLNKASAEQLQALPGVGPALAERIVAYRNAHGPFQDVEQLVEVKGIGQAKLAKLKQSLTVD